MLSVWRLQQQTTLPDLQLAWWLFVLLSALWIPRQARWQRITRYGLVVMFALLALDHLPVKIERSMSAVLRGSHLKCDGITFEMLHPTVENYAQEKI